MRRGLVMLGALLAALLVPVPAVASAASIALSPDAGPPTAPVRVVGSGFSPNDLVSLAFDRRVLKSLRASGQGNFASRVKVPATAEPGEHTVTARGQSSGEATATFTVRTDWPTFHLDPAKSGENPYENVLDPSNVGVLEVAWSEPVGDSVNQSPAIVDGVLYVPVDTPSMTIYALNPLDGSVIWSQTPGGAAPAPSQCGREGSM